MTKAGFGYTFWVELSFAFAFYIFKPHLSGTWVVTAIVPVLFINGNHNYWLFSRDPCTVYGPQTSIFSHFSIKNWSHNIIYIFKNYFAIVFSVLVFNFSKNKLYLNGSYVHLCHTPIGSDKMPLWTHRAYCFVTINTMQNLKKLFLLVLYLRH